MINDFVYNIPVKVYFGRDQLKHLGEELKRYGTRVLMTYGGGSIKRTGKMQVLNCMSCRASNQTHVSILYGRELRCAKSITLTYC